MDAIFKFFSDHRTLREIFMLIINAGVVFFGIWLALWAERKLYKKILESKNNINLRYVEAFVRFTIIFIGVQTLIMGSPITQPLGRTLFGGTTVIAAIAGFAAQPVISDMICGLMLSATRPFNIGDRIELDNGMAGIVKDITVRHVVIRGLDTTDIVIPNSRLNGMIVSNMSTQHLKRSIKCKFSVAYSTDIDRAIKVVSEAIQESPYTIPGHPGKDGGEHYAPVYFLEFADSSLILTTTVYYAPTSHTEVVRSDVNIRVKRALDSHGIEIPYNYVNVVMNREMENG